MTRCVARCPAKINLGLKILGRRPDGYHDLATIFQTIDLEDTLEGAPASELSLTCDDPSVPTGEDNLVLKAAREIARRVPAARGRGARLTLRKAIPAGGGLGGGSSDAAGAILLLEALWDLALSGALRHEIAAALGSDVPFFLFGGRALGEGRGERLTSLPSGAPLAVVLGTPPFGMATPEVFRALGAPLTPPGPDVTVTPFLVKLAEGNDFARAENDLERAAFALRPELAEFRDALASAGARPALLSGSGSSVFGIVAAREAGPAADGLRVRFRDWAVRVVATSTSAARVVSEAGS